jgi:hypothetical protein
MTTNNEEFVILNKMRINGYNGKDDNENIMGLTDKLVNF